MTKEALVRGSDELWQRRIVLERGALAYDFTHDKLRAVVYTNLSAARRRLLHRHVADALQQMHADKSRSDYRTGLAFILNGR